MHKLALVLAVLSLQVATNHTSNDSSTETTVAAGPKMPSSPAPAPRPTPRPLYPNPVVRG